MDNHNQSYGAPRSPRKRHKRRRLKIMPTVIAGLILLGLLFCLIMGIWTLVIASSLPDLNSESLIPTETSIIYDKDDQEFSRLFAAENRTLIEYQDLPQHLIDCVVATEDIRFYEHSGVDIRRVFGAALANLKLGSKSQGASTITMQLARNAVLETQEKKFSRKIRETLLAIQLERAYTKEEILAAYLNEVFFGHNVYGVESASMLYFNKSASELTLAESAMLAGMLRSPNTYSPINNVENANHIKDVGLANLEKYKGEEYAQAIAEAKEEEIVAPDSANAASVGSAGYAYPWFADTVIEEAVEILTAQGLPESAIYSGGYKIYSTADPKVQKRLEELYANPQNFPDSLTGDIVESAACVLDPQTGGIRGIIGGREYTVQRGFNRATDLVRSPGSTIKPVAVYAPAVEAGGLGAGSTVVDAPTTFGGDYSPTNYDGKWRGNVSMRTAIMYSVNVPAVKFLQKIGPKVGLDYAIKMGLPLDKNNDANLSLALGGVTGGVSPVDMAGAYATFANAGVHTEPYCITKIVDGGGKVVYEAAPQQTTVLSADTAYLITDMLTSVTTGGTGTRAAISGWQVASKTGTTQLPDKSIFKGKSGNKDAWFAAYTTELVGVVWMGYDNDVDDNGKAQYLRQIYGGKYPAMIWKSAVSAGLTGSRSKRFANPGGVVAVTIDKISGLLPGPLTPSEYITSEKFLSKSTPQELSQVWTQVDICPESGKLAGDYCPNHVWKALLLPPKETNKVDYLKSAQGELYAPKQSCPLHSEQGSHLLIPVAICTDPAHGGQIYRANVPADGSTGGCPSEYIKTQNFSLDNIPYEYCPLPAHQVKGETVKDNGKDSGVTVVTPKNPETDLFKPQGLTLKVAGGSVKLSWYDDNDPAGTQYIIERVTDNESSTAVRFTSHSKQYTDKTVEFGHKYAYRVYAYCSDDSKISEWSSFVSAEV